MAIIPNKVATILVKIVEQKDEKGKVINTFPSYKFIDDEHNGKLVDLRFKKDVNTALFSGMYKFKAKFGYWQETQAYEYPRIYASELDETSIEKIR